MDRSYQRALVLLDQRRFELAEQELRQALTAAPQDGYLHALLAECLAELERFEEAGDEAAQAIHLAPELPDAHAAQAGVLQRRRYYPEAVRAIAEALRLDPGNPNFCARLASLRIEQRDWEAALGAAERGLEDDPQHLACNNIRAMALVQLGRRDEAGATMASTLALGPEVAFSHANQGWALLHAGERQQALEHFREALRLDPTLDYARAGIVEALKAKNFIYALFLRYFLWMGRLSRSGQWVILLVGYFGYRALAGFARDNPEWTPWVLPLIIVYVVFALMTWIASPLFNLLLRFDRYGRHALTRNDLVESNWIGGLVLLALGCLVWWLMTDYDLALLGAMMSGMMLLPVSARFQSEPGWPRKFMTFYALALAVAGAVALALALINSPDTVIWFQIFLWGSFLSGLVGNLIVAQSVRR